MIQASRTGNWLGGSRLQLCSFNGRCTFRKTQRMWLIHVHTCFWGKRRRCLNDGDVHLQAQTHIRLTEDMRDTLPLYYSSSIVKLLQALHQGQQTTNHCQNTVNTDQMLPKYYVRHSRLFPPSHLQTCATVPRQCVHLQSHYCCTMISTSELTS